MFIKPGGLINNRNVFLSALEAGSASTGRKHSQVLIRATSTS